MQHAYEQSVPVLIPSPNIERADLVPSYITFTTNVSPT